MTTALAERTDHLFPFTGAKFRQYDKSGRLLWGSKLELPKGGRPILKGSPRDLAAIRDQLWTANNLADEGEKDILDVYFDDVAVRANTYARLYNDTPGETDGLSDLTGEASGNGYAAATFARGTDWGDPTLDSGDMQTTSTTKSFSASGGSWGPVTYAVLATVATGTSGLLLAYVALSSSRTLTDGDSMNVDWAVKLA